MALAQNIDVLWIICHQHDAPKPMINTCNEYYCSQFKHNNHKSPKMFIENWIGSVKPLNPHTFTIAKEPIKLKKISNQEIKGIEK
ncbi:Beta-galactosidase 3, partial [Mucuna pruriens]